MSAVNKNDSKTKLQGSLLLFTGGLIWGLHHIIVRVSLESVSAHQLQVYEYVIATIVLFAIFFKSIKKITKKEILHGTVIGLTVFIGQMLQMVATGLTTVGKMSFITTLYVIMVPLLAWIIFKKKIGITNLIAVVLSIAGLYLLTQASGGINKGDVLAFLGSLCFTIQMLYIDKCVVNDDPKNLTFVQVASSAIFALIVLLITGEPIVLTGVDFTGWLGILYVSLLSCALGFFLQIAGQEKVSPQLCSIILTTEAPAATIFAAVLLGEAMTLPAGIGCTLMLIAMIVAQF